MLSVYIKGIPMTTVFAADMIENTTSVETSEWSKSMIYERPFCDLAWIAN